MGPGRPDPATPGHPHRFAGRPPRDEPRPRLSETLMRLAEDPGRARISMADLVALMPGQALAALMLVLATPNALPGPPGLSAILGLPLIYLSWQMMTGQPPWLPPVIARRSVARSQFAALVGRIAPILGWIERRLRPRLGALVGWQAERVLGGLCLILSVVLVLPVPLGNILPSLAISVMMLGLLERDGLWVLGGIVTAILSLVVAVGVVYAIVEAIIFLLSRALA